MKQKNNMLIFIPTYNEKDNLPLLLQRIAHLKLDANILVMDDNSPDGTGEIAENLRIEYPNLIVHHRSEKLGIGSAHKAGIQWAYDNHFDLLITLDADFTHPPESIPTLLEKLSTKDLVLTSRYLKKNSLSEWNLFRKAMTWCAHLLTTILLGMKYDATGAFRVYRLSTIPKELFPLAQSDGYSFFFESLYILHANALKIIEVPISLPTRTYGSSKMSYKEIFRSVHLLLVLFFRRLFHERSIQLTRTAPNKGINQ